MKSARLICIGKIKTKCWQEAANHYLNQLRHWRKIEITELRDGSGAREQRMVQEARSINGALDSSDFPIALTEQGRQFSSKNFAQFLRCCEENEIYRPAFIIGGPFGLAQDILERSKELLSLSSMTWPHELARVLLLEQLYRAESILRNLPYHH